MNKKQKKIAKKLLAEINKQGSIENTHGAIRCYCDFMIECRQQDDLEKVRDSLIVKGIQLATGNKSFNMPTTFYSGQGMSMGICESHGFQEK